MLRVCHLLAAYLALYSEQWKASSAALEQARSCDFDVRNTRTLPLRQGASYSSPSGQLDDARKVLAGRHVDLPGVRTSSTDHSRHHWSSR